MTEDKFGQEKIGSFFKQLDATIALHQRKLDLLKEQKNTTNIIRLGTILENISTFLNSGSIIRITPIKTIKNSPFNLTVRIKGLFIYFNDIITLKGVG